MERYFTNIDNPQRTTQAEHHKIQTECGIVIFLIAKHCM
jgi:hypothetical protein